MHTRALTLTNGIRTPRPDTHRAIEIDMVQGVQEQQQAPRTISVGLVSRTMPGT